MSEEPKKGGVSKNNLIIGIVLLVLLIFLFGADAFSWMSDTALRVIIGVAIGLVIFFSIRSLNQK